MAAVKPIKLKSDGGLANFQAGDFVPVDQGGTGAVTAAGARSALGLAIGSDVQAFDADLAAIAAIAALGIPVRTAANTWAIREIAGVSGRTTVTNPAGTAGNPTVDLATVANAGGGVLRRVAVDGYGRVSGYTTAVAADITALVDGIYARLDGATFTNFVTLHANPTNPLHAVTKQYVDALVAAGGIPPFAPAKVATVGNITLSGTQTIDGIAVVAADRVLVRAQSTASQNGIYVVAAGAWTRAADANDNEEFSPAREVFVEQGATYGQTSFAVGNATQPTLGTTAITWVQTSGTNQYTNGNGLNLTGFQFSVQPVSGQITVTGSGVGLATTAITPGTYTKVTFDQFGRATAGDTATPADIGAQPANAQLTALAALATNGIIVRTAANTFASRTITGTSGQIDVANGDGVSGNPTLSLPDSGITAGTYNGITFDSKGRATAAQAITSDALTYSATNNQGAAIAIGRAVYISGGGTVALANANASGTVEAVGLVYDTSIANSAVGRVARLGSGYMDATTNQWDSVTGQTGGLTPGAPYYLSNSSNGALTTTAPTTGYVKRVGIAQSTTRMLLQDGPVVHL